MIIIFKSRHGFLAFDTGAYRYRYITNDKGFIPINWHSSRESVFDKLRDKEGVELIAKLDPKEDINDFISKNYPEELI